MSFEKQIFHGKEKNVLNHNSNFYQKFSRIGLLQKGESKHLLGINGIPKQYRGEHMADIKWSKIFKDKNMLLKAAGLSYMGLGLYLAMKEKPKIIPKRKEDTYRAPRKRVKTEPRTLGDMIAKMIEETYGIERK